MGRHIAVPSEDCDYLLQTLCDWLNSEFKEEDGIRIGQGILRAIVARIYMVWIHPFSNGNCRTSGLLEYHLLLSSGLPSNIAHLLSIHYAQTRTEYHEQISALKKNKGRIGPLIEYALQGFYDGQKELLNKIQSAQLSALWRNHINDSFRNSKTKQDQRLKQLIVDLSTQNIPVPISSIRRLTPRIAEQYANKSNKTVARDITILQEMDLIKRTDRGVRANHELLIAFEPILK